MRRRVRTLIWLLLWGGAIEAIAETEHQTALFLSQSYEDNYGLRQTQERELWISSAFLRHSYSINEPRFRNALLAEFAHKALRGDDEGLSDSVSLRLGLSGGYELSERNSLSYSISSFSDKNSTDEFEESLGFVRLRERDVDKRKFTHNASVSAQSYLNERVSLSWQASLNDTSYDEAESTQLVDYTYLSTQLKGTLLAHEHWTFFGIVEHSNFDPKPSEQLIQKANAVASQSMSALLGLGWQVNERWSLSLGTGHRKSDYERELGVKSKDSGRQFFLELRRQGEHFELSSEFTEQLEPSADGAARLVRRAQLRLRSQLNESLIMRLTGAYEFEQRRVERLDPQKEELLETIASLSQSLSRTQTLSGRLRYRRLLEGREPENLKFELTWRCQF